MTDREIYLRIRYKVFPRLREWRYHRLVKGTVDEQEKQALNQEVDKRAFQAAQELEKAGQTQKAASIHKLIGNKDWIGLLRGLLHKAGVPDYAVDDSVNDFFVSLHSGEKDDPFVAYAKLDNPVDFDNFFAGFAKVRGRREQAKLKQESERFRTNARYSGESGDELDLVEQADIEDTDRGRLAEREEALEGLNVSDVEKRILRYLSTDPQAGARSIAWRLRINLEDVQQALASLAERDLVPKRKAEFKRPKFPKDMPYNERVAQFFRENPEFAVPDARGFSGVIRHHEGGRRPRTREMQEALAAVGRKLSGTTRYDYVPIKERGKTPPEPTPPKLEEPPPSTPES